MGAGEVAKDLASEAVEVGRSEGDVPPQARLKTTVVSTAIAGNRREFMGRSFYSPLVALSRPHPLPLADIGPAFFGE
jgi:hypothetical protein